MNHHNHSVEKVEYYKFAGVLAFIFVDALFIAAVTRLSLMFALMGVFMTVFAAFKLYSRQEFAAGFKEYDLIAQKYDWYAKAFPFIQLGLGLIYLIGRANTFIHIVTFLVAAVSAAGVLKALRSKKDVHCVCLGNVIKLPLSRISFVEDSGMALMALAMILF